MEGALLPNNRGHLRTPPLGHDVELRDRRIEATHREALGKHAAGDLATAVLRGAIIAELGELALLQADDGEHALDRTRGCAGLDGVSSSLHQLQAILEGPNAGSSERCVLANGETSARYGLVEDIRVLDFEFLQGAHVRDIHEGLHHALVPDPEKVASVEKLDDIVVEDRLRPLQDVLHARQGLCGLVDHARALRALAWEEEPGDNNPVLVLLLLVLLVFLVLLLLDLRSRLDGLLFCLFRGDATPLFLRLLLFAQALRLFRSLALRHSRLDRLDLLLRAHSHVLVGAELEWTRASPRRLGPATPAALACELARVGPRGDGVAPQGIQDPVGVLRQVCERPREGRLPGGCLIPGQRRPKEGAARRLHTSRDVLLEAHVQVLDAFLSRLGRRNIHGS
mmetsp:Transcript_50641/g.108461  ORF Transcript_50641/g.108461 Transcript_50641/m.108461 type:complete len:396 (+) Transcript_50641:419-1606(+)